MKTQERFVRTMMPMGNLFLLLTLPELRRQGMTYLSLYTLERAIEVAGRSSVDRYSGYWLRREIGLEDYETSRACSLLAKAGLVKISKDPEDRRVRLLTPTALGLRIHSKILSTAANRLWDSIPPPGRIRRVTQTTKSLQHANSILLGSLQLSFFDTDLFDKEPKRKSSRKRSQTLGRGTSARKPSQKKKL